ncbi:MAG: agmatine deiminase family protein [Betaproteobacteria bacterium]
MPAEWQPHEATWLGWPHNLSDWPGRFAPIPWVYGEIVRKLADGERVRILVPSRGHETAARRLLSRVGAASERVEFFRWPTDRGWTRDFGPVCVRRERPRPQVAVARFRFNGWAKYPDHRRDDRVPERVARTLSLELRPVVHRGRPVVLEGGAFDVNGAGTALTTEECLLDPLVQVRNPGFGRADYEQVLAGALGASRTIWLGRGIAGDDTHGHVDDLCRFAGPRTIVLCQEPDGSDVNHRPLAENRERLQQARLADGGRPEVVALPMPAPLVFDGRRLPASYANFYVANAAVLVPTFNDPRDRTALGILGELFADRPVVGIHAVELVWGLGTLHCLTQQQPSA